MFDQSPTPVRFPGDTQPDTPRPTENEHVEAARRQARQDPLQSVRR